MSLQRATRASRGRRPHANRGVNEHFASNRVGGAARNRAEPSVSSPWEENYELDRTWRVKDHIPSSPALSLTTPMIL